MIVSGSGKLSAMATPAPA